MPIFDNPAIIREIIADHYKRPNFKFTPENHEKYLQIHMDSPNCIDDIIIYILLKKNIIEKVSFDGIGCAISTASTDIMCEMMQEKTKEDALHLVEQFTNMLYEKEYDSDVLGEALVFVNTSKQAARIKCASIGWEGLKQGLEDDKNE